MQTADLMRVLRSEEQLKTQLLASNKRNKDLENELKVCVACRYDDALAHYLPVCASTILCDISNMFHVLQEARAELKIYRDRECIAQANSD